MQRGPPCRVCSRATATATLELELELEIVGLKLCSAGGAGHRTAAATAAMWTEAAHRQRRRFAQACERACGGQSAEP